LRGARSDPGLTRELERAFAHLLQARPRSRAFGRIGQGQPAPALPTKIDAPADVSTPRSEMKHLKVNLPGYVWTEQKKPQ